MSHVRPFHHSLLALLLVTSLSSGPLAAAEANAPTGAILSEGVLVIKPDRMPPDLLLASMMLLRAARGLSTAASAEIPVQLAPDLGTALGRYAHRLRGFALTSMRLDLLLPHPQAEGRSLATGAFWLTDAQQRRIELGFTIDHGREGRQVRIHRAGLQFVSPLRPQVWVALVAADRALPLREFGSFADAARFAARHHLDVSPPPRGRRAYDAYVFFLDFLPRDDRVSVVTSSRDATGPDGEAGVQEQSNYGGWRVVRISRTLDLSTGEPVYFKALHRPGATLGAKMRGRPRVVYAGTPMQGGKRVFTKGKGFRTVSPATVPSPGAARPSPSASDEPENLALHRPTRVSSISRYSKVQDVGKDGAGAVDGRRGNGDFAFHTDKQPDPWWQVDIGPDAVVHRLTIHNRTTCCLERARSLRVLLSQDGIRWRAVHDQGGRTFRRLDIRIAPVQARFVRLQLAGTDYLHLEEVEIYGTRGAGSSPDMMSGTSSATAAGGLGGHWQVPEWKTGLDLWQRGDRLLAFYSPKNDRGWLWLTRSGAGYIGWWKETVSNERCATQKAGSFYWGRLSLIPGKDGIGGRWSYCDKPLSRPWNGQRRADAPRLEQPPDWSLFE